MLFSVRFAAEIDDTKELRESASSAWETSSTPCHASDHAS